MLNSILVNQSFTGVSIPTGTPPVNITSSSLISNSLTVLNTPIVGRTLVGKPGTNFYSSMVGTSVLIANNPIGPDNQPIPLPNDNSYFFQGLTLKWDKYPGPLATWIGANTVFIGTNTVGTFPINSTLNGGDGAMGPLNLPFTPTTTTQVVEYYPVYTSQLPGAFVPHGTTSPTPNQLNKFCTGATGKNYLAILPGVVISPTATVSGTFTIFLTYITIV